MIVDRYREILLSLLLPDDILIEEFMDLLGDRYGLATLILIALIFLIAEDIVLAIIDKRDALIANGEIGQDIIDDIGGGLSPPTHDASFTTFWSH